LLNSIVSCFQHIGLYAYSGYDLDLSGSHSVISYVTIRFPVGYFLVVVHWNRASISRRFRDIWLYAYSGHDLDLSRSRDMIGHVTIRLAIGHFLLMLFWNQASISDDLRDIQWRMWRDDWHDLERPL